MLIAGTGGKGELGEQAAQESHDQLGQAVSNADMVGFPHLLPDNHLYHLQDCSCRSQGLESLR